MRRRPSALAECMEEEQTAEEMAEQTGTFASVVGSLFAGPPFSHWRLPAVLSARAVSPVRLGGEQQFHSTVPPSSESSSSRQRESKARWSPAAAPARLCAFCEASSPERLFFSASALTEEGLARDAKAAATQALGSCAASVETIVAAGAVAAGTHRAASLARRASVLSGETRSSRGARACSDVPPHCLLDTALFDRELVDQATRVLERGGLQTAALAEKDSAEREEHAAASPPPERDFLFLSALKERREHLRRCLGLWKQTQQTVVAGGREVQVSLQIYTTLKSVAVLVGDECRLKVQCLYTPICASIVVAAGCGSPWDSREAQDFPFGEKDEESSPGVCLRRRMRSQESRSPRQQSSFLWILTSGPAGEDKTILEKIALRSHGLTAATPSACGPLSRVFYALPLLCNELWTPSRAGGLAFVLPVERGFLSPLLFGAGTAQEGLGGGVPEEVFFKCCSCCLPTVGSTGRRSSSLVEFARVDRRQKTQAEEETPSPARRLCANPKAFSELPIARLGETAFCFRGFCRELPLILAESRTSSCSRLLFLALQKPTASRDASFGPEPAGAFKKEGLKLCFIQTAAFDLHCADSRTGMPCQEEEEECVSHQSPSLLFLPYRSSCTANGAASRAERVRVCFLHKRKSELLLLPLCSRRAAGEWGPETAFEGSEESKCLFEKASAEVIRLRNALGFCCLRQGGQAAFSAVDAASFEGWSTEEGSSSRVLRLSLAPPSPHAASAPPLHFFVAESELPRFLVVLHGDGRLCVYAGEVPLQELLFVHPKRGLLRGARPLAVSAPVGCSFNATFLLLEEDVLGEPLSRLATFRCCVRLRPSSWLLQLCLENLLERLEGPAASALLVAVFRFCLSPGCASAISFLWTREEQDGAIVQEQQDRLARRQPPSPAAAEWRAFCAFLFLLTFPSACVCGGGRRLLDEALNRESRVFGLNAEPHCDGGSGSRSCGVCWEETKEALRGGAGFLDNSSGDPWLRAFASSVKRVETCAAFSASTPSAVPSSGTCENSWQRSGRPVVSEEAAGVWVFEEAAFSLRVFEEAAGTSPYGGLRRHLPVVFLSLHFVLEELLLRADFAREEVAALRELTLALARRLRLSPFVEHYGLLLPAAREPCVAAPGLGDAAPSSGETPCLRCLPPLLVQLRLSPSVPSFADALRLLVKQGRAERHASSYGRLTSSALRAAFAGRWEERRSSLRGARLFDKRALQGGLFQSSPRRRKLPADATSVSASEGHFEDREGEAAEAEEEASRHGVERMAVEEAVPRDTEEIWRYTPKEGPPALAEVFTLAGEVRGSEGNAFAFFALPLTRVLLNAVAVAVGAETAGGAAFVSAKLGGRFLPWKKGAWSERVLSVLKMVVENGLAREGGLERLWPPLQIWLRFLFAPLSRRGDLLRLRETLGRHFLEALLLLQRRDAAGNALLIHQEGRRAAVGCGSCLCTMHSSSLLFGGEEGLEFESTQVAEAAAQSGFWEAPSKAAPPSSEASCPPSLRSKEGGLGSWDFADFLLSSSRLCSARVFVESAASVPAAAAEPLQQLQIQALGRHFALTVGRGAARLGSRVRQEFFCGTAEIPFIQTRCEVTPVSTLQQSPLFESRETRGTAAQQQQPHLQTQSQQPPGLADAFSWDSLDDDESGSAAVAGSALVELEALSLPRQVLQHAPVAVVFSNACAAVLELSRHPEFSSFLRSAEVGGRGRREWPCCCGGSPFEIEEGDAFAVKGLRPSEGAWFSEAKEVQLFVRDVVKKQFALRPEESLAAPSAGCLLGLALQGHLRALQPPAWIELLDEFQSQPREQTLTAVSVLLGACVSQLGSKSQALRRLCQMHVAYASPAASSSSTTPASSWTPPRASGADSETALNGGSAVVGDVGTDAAGAAALVGLGFLHFGSGDAQLARMFSAQIRRPLSRRGGPAQPPPQTAPSPNASQNNPAFQTSTTCLLLQQHCAFSAAWALGAVCVGSVSANKSFSSMTKRRSEAGEGGALRSREFREAEELRECVRELLCIANANFALPWGDASSVPAVAKGGFLGARSGSGSFVFATLSQQASLLEVANAAAAAASSSGGVPSPVGLGGSASQTRLLLSPAGGASLSGEASSFWLRSGAERSADKSAHAGGAPAGLVAPPAALALGLAFWRTGDEEVARALRLPETPREANEALPSVVAYKVFAKALIRWDSIAPSHSWIVSQLPPMLRLFPGETDTEKETKKETKKETEKETGKKDSDAANANASAAPLRLPYASLLDPVTRLVCRRQQRKSNFRAISRDPPPDPPPRRASPSSCSSSSLNLFHCHALRAHALAAALWSVGLRFAGTQDAKALNLLLDYYEAFSAGKVASGSQPPSLSSSTPAGGDGGGGGLRPSHNWRLEELAWLAAVPVRSAAVQRRVGLDSESAALVLRSVGAALSLVASGSGDGRVLQILMRERRRLSSCARSTPGEQQLLHQSLGILFLGKCRWALRSTSCSPLSVASLVLALQPLSPTLAVFAPHSGGTASSLAEWPLTGESHLFVLAAEPRRLRAVDVDSGQEVTRLPVEICMRRRQPHRGGGGERKARRVAMTTMLPALLPDPSELLSLKIKSPQFAPLKVEGRRCCRCPLRSLLSSGVVLVQRLPFADATHPEEDEALPSSRGSGRNAFSAEGETQQQHASLKLSSACSAAVCPQERAVLGEGGRRHLSLFWLRLLKRLLRHAAGSGDRMAIDASAASGRAHLKRCLQLLRDTPRTQGKKAKPRCTRHGRDVSPADSEDSSDLAEDQEEEDAEEEDEQDDADDSSSKVLGVCPSDRVVSEARLAERFLRLLPSLGCGAFPQLALLQPWIAIAEGARKGSRRVWAVHPSSLRQLRLLLKLTQVGQAAGEPSRALRELFLKCAFRAEAALEESGARALVFEAFLEAAQNALRKAKTETAAACGEAPLPEATVAAARRRSRCCEEEAQQRIACFQTLHGLPLLSQWQMFLEAELRGREEFSSKTSPPLSRQGAAAAMASLAAPSASPEGLALLEEVLSSVLESV